MFVAVGAHLSKHMAIPARDASKIIDAVPFLRDIGAGARPVLGRRWQCTAAVTPRWTRPGPRFRFRR